MTKTPQHLFRHSWIWQLLAFYTGLAQRLFYKSIIVEGKDNIPESGPVMYAPNHQNALMDPMLVVYGAGKQIVFLARADIFSNNFLGSILKRMKILPVYRIRDGKKNLIKNEDSFEMLTDVLAHNMPVGIFPEAAHSNKRRLLSLKKGVPRVAFLSEERNDFKLGVKIIPVGIYYSNYDNYRSVAHVRFGKAIEVSEYLELYKENDKKANLALRETIQKSLLPLVIDIRNLELYDIYESLRALYVKQLIKKFQLGKLSQINKFRADKITIKALDRYAEVNPEQMLELSSIVKQYNLLKKKYNLSNRSVEKPKHNLFRLVVSSLLLLLLLPIFIYGFLNNIFTYLLPKVLISRIKDKQFHSTAKFVWAIILIPIIYIIQFFVFNAIFSSWLWAAIYLVSLPISWFGAQKWFDWGALIFQDWEKLKMKWYYKQDYKKIKELHLEIVTTLDRIVEDTP